MTGQERLEVLRSVAELRGADRAELQTLLPFFDEVSVPPGVVVARNGHLAHEFLVVAGGELEVCGRAGASRLGPGEAYGWQAMHERGRHDTTVVTVSPARLLVMGHSQFRAIEAVGIASVQSAGHLEPSIPSGADSRLAS